MPLKYIKIIFTLLVAFSLSTSCKIYQHASKSTIEKKPPIEKKEKIKKRKYFTYGLKAKKGSEVGDIYIVKKGDSLFSIALEYEVDYKQIAKWNNINKPYILRVGDKIIIKPNNVRKHKNISESKSVKNIRWVKPHKGTIFKSFNFSEYGKKGIDIRGNIGDKIFSAADGKIVYAGNGIKGYGNLLIIKHSNNFLSAYAHNKNLFVREGDNVKRGDVVAALGDTDAIQPMLHFQIRYNGKPVDPEKYLP